MTDKEKIEAMKCCGNCAHWRPHNGVCPYYHNPKGYEICAHWLWFNLAIEHRTVSCRKKIDQ